MGAQRKLSVGCLEPFQHPGGEPEASSSPRLRQSPSPGPVLHLGPLFPRPAGDTTTPPPPPPPRPAPRALRTGARISPGQPAAVAAPSSPAAAAAAGQPGPGSSPPRTPRLHGGTCGRVPPPEGPELLLGKGREGGKQSEARSYLQRRHPTAPAIASGAGGRRSSCFSLPWTENYRSPGEVGRGRGGSQASPATPTAAPRSYLQSALKGPIPPPPWQPQANSSLRLLLGTARPVARERGPSLRSCCNVGKGQKAGEDPTSAINGGGGEEWSLTPGAIFLNPLPGSGRDCGRSRPGSESPVGLVGVREHLGLCKYKLSKAEKPTAFFFFFFFFLVTKEREAKSGVYSTIQLERERNPTIEKAHLKGTVCFLRNQRLISNSH